MSFYKEVPGRQTTLESTLKFDIEPKAGSTNPVTSDGIASAITEAVGTASDALQEQIVDSGYDVASILDDCSRGSFDFDNFLLSGQGVKISDFDNVSKTDDEIVADCFNFVKPLKNKIVIIDRDVTISHAILLEENTLVIINGVTITQADETFDNVFRSANSGLKDDDYAYLPTTMETLHNIGIVGLDGAQIVGPDVQKYLLHTPTNTTIPAVGDWFGVRTNQINFAMVENALIQGIEFTKTRGWCIAFSYCTYVKCKNLKITSDVKNGDGIDFRVGCRHCIVDNLDAFVTDDAVAMTSLANTDGVYPKGNYMYAYESTAAMNASLLAKDPRACDIFDISVSNVSFKGKGIGGHGLICLSSYGGRVHHVLVNNFVEGESVDVKESLIKIFTGYGAGYTDGDINNIRLNNFISTECTYALMIKCKVIEVWANDFKYEKNRGSITNYSGVRLTNYEQITP